MQTLESFTKDDPNHPDYDFIDQEYGKVNVKAANPNKQKNKDIWTWTWEIQPKQDADTFPLVYLDRNRQPMGMFIVTRVGDNFNFPSNLRVVRWANGCWGISIKATKDRPSNTDWVTGGSDTESTPEIEDESGTETSSPSECGINPIHPGRESEIDSESNSDDESSPNTDSSESAYNTTLSSPS
jgi:hypothetical protein